MVFLIWRKERFAPDGALLSLAAPASLPLLTRTCGRLPLLALSSSAPGGVRARPSHAGARRSSSNLALFNHVKEHSEVSALLRGGEEEI